jgi:hypothetical protein
MKYKLSKLAPILTGLIGGAVLLASSGVYAGMETPETPIHSKSRILLIGQVD